MVGRAVTSRSVLLTPPADARSAVRTIPTRIAIRALISPNATQGWDRSAGIPPCMARRTSSRAPRSWETRFAAIGRWIDRRRGSGRVVRPAATERRPGWSVVTDEPVADQPAATEAPALTPIMHGKRRSSGGFRP